MLKNEGVSSGSGGDSVTEENAVGRPVFEHSGWVYHLGTNSIKREYCHRRFLHIKGKYVMMYKRNPHEHAGTDLYVLKFSNRLDEEKKGEAECELSQSSNTRDKLSMANEINLGRHGRRHRVKQYANRLKSLIRTKQGGESLVRRSLSVSASHRSVDFCEIEAADVIEEHEWKCVCALYGVRILEDVSGYKGSKGVLVKAVTVMEVSPNSVFEVIMSLDRHQRYEYAYAKQFIFAYYHNCIAIVNICRWDSLTSNLELVDSISGNSDVVYGTYDSRHLTKWKCKRDFIFSRQWFCDQDGTYTILQFPAVHKKRPPKSGYRRTKINPSTWEIKNLSTPVPTNGSRCLVTQMLEVHSKGWSKWKANQSSKFEKTVPYALLSQVSGLKVYTSTKSATSTVLHKEVSSSINDFEDEDEVADQFYDAISSYPSSSSSSEDDDDDDTDYDDAQDQNMKQTVSCLNQKRNPDPGSSHFCGSMCEGKSETDTDCWMSPSGKGFMIRGKTYLKDNAKVSGGDPLLKLIAVDWFKVNNPASKVALHPKCLLQSEAGKKLPFVLVMNLQVPAKPNYSLVLYFASDKPVVKDSLLGRFIDETNTFRDSRFKLIPSIVEGYWMVKRAVGSKACLLGKAVSCNYLRQDNFLEIDVDIGSSSVARNVINIVLGYGKEQEELPEYILGTVRLNRVRLESAVPLES
ncbi:hypothetical protein L1987_64813 [Smallanthus sonchifolius]|uniref:Uncharacterized protein n=1 Tax=Smallanthus sonchifolius TaxID=185202 RepID=A0ACB9BSS8_9ASTR|nr:hypothetical protein L1987_64813 [Smallanthus sonchifolius]